MRFIIIILTLLVFSGCIDKNKVPDGVLGQQQMRLVMWDLMRADEFVNDFVIKDSTKDRKTESIKLYEKIFALHNTSQEEFRKSLTFYESRPDLLKTVTDSLRINQNKAMENPYSSPKPGLDTNKIKPRPAPIKSGK